MADPADPSARLSFDGGAASAKSSYTVRDASEADDLAVVFKMPDAEKLLWKLAMLVCLLWPVGRFGLGRILGIPPETVAILLG
jgi:hypothetical protein